MEDINMDNQMKKVSPYRSALKEFIRASIQNPDFFNLSINKQQDLAMNTIQKHKMEALFQGVVLKRAIENKAVCN
jgi:ABC-type transport system involved in cytochrome bd biosynthesis fused ATPase/permease subunit